jgi:hypothetical protein
MIEAMAPVRARATLVGSVAARALRENAAGVVHSVFERSAYVVFETQWVCVGPRGLGAGPLNVLCEPWVSSALLHSMLPAGAKARVTNATLELGRLFAVDRRDAETWLPKTRQKVVPARLASGLGALEVSLPNPLPTEGLARLIDPGMQEGAAPPIIVTARSVSACLAQWISASMAEATQPLDAGRLAPLVGLGPGLTPSGDDFFGGALVALDHVGRPRLRDALWAVLSPLAGNTTDVSRAHLDAAAEGFGSAALHDALAALCEGDVRAMPDRIAALTAIGHTSGWDALAGAVCVLRAFAVRA